MIKKTLALILVILTCLSIISCSEDPVVFSHCELTIPLAEDFYEISDENFDVSYTNGASVVAILRISHDAAVNEGISNLLTAYEFGEYWIERCERDTNLISGGGAVWCDYYDGEGTAARYYLEAFYRSKHAYFVVLFATSAGLADASRTGFLEYAKGVNFV